MSARLAPNHLRGDHPALLLHFTRVLPSGCWEFTGYIAPTGYGQLGRNIPAHRIAWEVANGRPVPIGLVIDHQCHNRDPHCNDEDQCTHRRCVNPNHLEAVPQRINLLRGKGFAGVNAAAERCPAGHLYDEVNTYYRPTGRFGRMCRECRRERNREAFARRGRRLVDPETPLIRAWALAAGLPVKDRGAIPRHIQAAYYAALPLAA
jgi:hypothetical protein